jgi:hypothetical protein
MDRTKQTVKYGVFVQSEGKLSDLKKALSPLCGVPVKRLKAVQIQGNKTYSCLFGEFDESSCFDLFIFSSFL